MNGLDLKAGDKIRCKDMREARRILTDLEQEGWNMNLTFEHKEQKNTPIITMVGKVEKREDV